MDEFITKASIYLVVSLLPLVLFVVIQNVLSFCFINRVLNNSFSRTAYFLTAAIGVPVHELSHAIVAKVFSHKVLKVQFFQFSPNHGRLGFVEHQWQVHSIYQTSGLFFIGIAPLLGAGALICLLTFYIQPHFFELASHLVVSSSFEWQNEYSSLSSFIQTSLGLVMIVFESNKDSLFYYWLAIVSVIAFFSTPSAADMRNALRGAVVFFTVLFALFLLLPANSVFSLLLSFWVHMCVAMTMLLALSMWWWLVLVGFSCVPRSTQIRK